MSGWSIRDERPEDTERVHTIQEAAFGQPDEADLVDVLRGGAKPQLSLVAERAGELVGHVFFSPVSIEGALAAPPCAGLAPVGVLPTEQGRGAGCALVQEGLSRSRYIGWKAVFLLGNPAYYQRFGFVLAAPRGFHYESDANDPSFQMIELEPAALRGLEGRILYHDAFAKLS